MSVAKTLTQIGTTIIGSCVLLGLCFLAPELGMAQEDPSLESLQQKWAELQAQLDTAETALSSPEGDLTAKQDSFRGLVDQANALIGQLADSAKKLLAEEPNDKNALRTLLGIMVNYASQNNDAEVLQLGDVLIDQGINPEYFKVAAKTERLTIAGREIFDELVIRQEEALANDLPRVKLTTTKGDIVIELFENEAPNTVGNFISLVESGFYSDILFHRVVEGFMAQGGGYKMVDGIEEGGEGPGYEIKCECYEIDKRPHFTGSLSMAHRGKDTGGSQFFLTFDRTDFLDGRHTCFGRVIEGMDVLEMLTRTHIAATKSPTGREQPIPGVTKDKIVTAEVIRKRDHEYEPDKVLGAKDPESDAKAPESKDQSTEDQSGENSSESAETPEVSPELSAPESTKSESQAENADGKKENPDTNQDGSSSKKEDQS
ncbi:MAG: peptidylprolyl isomerase [Planctomycetota bacterium]